MKKVIAYALAVGLFMASPLTTAALEEVRDKMPLDSGAEAEAQLRTNGGKLYTCGPAEAYSYSTSDTIDNADSEHFYFEAKVWQEDGSTCDEDLYTSYEITNYYQPSGSISCPTQYEEVYADDDPFVDDTRDFELFTECSVYDCSTTAEVSHKYYIDYREDPSEDTAQQTTYLYDNSQC